MGKLLIAVPCLDSLPATFVSSLCNMLGSGTIGNASIGFEVQSLVYESRNILAAKAVNGGYERILWLDSDMCFEPDLAKRLAADMDEGRDFVSAVYFKRRLPTSPVIAKHIDWYEDENGWPQSLAETYEDYPKDSVFEIAGCGFGAVMMKTELLTMALTAFRCTPFTPMPYLSEDYAFCWRLGKLGVKMWADSRIPIRHCGLWLYGEQDWDRQREVQE